MCFECVAGNFLHIYQDPDAAALQTESRSGEIHRLQIQVYTSDSVSECQE